MDDQPQTTQPDFLYTLATNGQFDRIARYLGSNDSLGVRLGAAGILAEFGDGVRRADNGEIKQQLISGVLNETNETVRARIVEALLYIHDEDIIETLVRKVAADTEPTPTDSPHPLVLVEWLGSDHPELRLLAVAGLGDVGTHTVVPKLASACTDDDYRVRARAIEECGRVGDHRCVDALVDALDSYDEAIKMKAARSLAQIGGDTAIEALIDAAKTDNTELRRTVIESLGTLGSLDVLTILLNGIDDSDDAVQQAAAESVVELVYQAPFEESHTVRETVVEELRANTDSDTVPIFLRLFVESDRRAIRRNTVWLLGHIANPHPREETVKTLIDALDADGGTTAQIAATSLVRIGGIDLEDQLADAIDSYETSEDARQRAKFVHSQITDSDAEELLKETVEYVRVTEPADYTAQKRDE